MLVCCTSATSLIEAVWRAISQAPFFWMGFRPSARQSLRRLAADLSLISANAYSTMSEALR